MINEKNTTKFLEISNTEGFRKIRFIKFISRGLERERNKRWQTVVLSH